MTDWCILRTSGRNTLPLAENLEKAGFECWTPTAKFKRRLPRTRKEVDAFAPIMPEYVFAKDRYFEALLAIEPLHPLFSMFRVPLQDGNKYFPFIADGSLDALRWADYRWTPPAPPPKPEPRHYAPGEVVTVPCGAWAGMSGVVEKTKGKWVVITFDRIEVEIERWKLDDHYRQAA